MEPQAFQENVSEWIKITNTRLSQMQEAIDDIGLAQEEDLMTLSYQYQTIKDLSKRIIKIERILPLLQQREKENKLTRRC